jgi:hypothetical protein
MPVARRGSTHLAGGRVWDGLDSAMTGEVYVDGG